MGEIAEMMLEGTLCQVCGVYMGDGDGFAVTCRGCGGDDNDAAHKRKSAPKESPEDREIRRWNHGRNYGAGVRLAMHHPKGAGAKIARLERDIEELKKRLGQ